MRNISSIKDMNMWKGVRAYYEQVKRQSVNRELVLSLNSAFDFALHLP